MNTKNFLTLTKRYKTLLSSFHSVYRLISYTFDLKSLIYRLSRLLLQITEAQYCLIAILDKSKQYSVLKCVISKRHRHLFDKRSRIINPLEIKIIKNAASIRSSHLLAVPILAEDTIGYIIIRRDKSIRPFDNFDQELLSTLCEQVVTGIRNIQLYEEQQKIVLGSIKSLVTLLDAKVPVIYTHSHYFKNLVLSIAREMHLDAKELSTLAYASLLHDAGKVDVPVEILAKTKRLTAQEFKIIKSHPIKGAQILKHIQILKPIVPIILHHHERYDGKGYPSGLKAGKIPLGARIMSLADAFEAMVYGRPYRKRILIQEAIKEIKTNSGKQFDPKVVDAFLRVLKKGRLKKILH